MDRIRSLSDRWREFLERQKRREQPSVSEGTPSAKRADASGEAGDHAAANLYKQRLGRDPHYFEALIGLGLVYGFTGRFDESIDLLKRAVDVRPSSLEARTHLAKTYLMLGMYEGRMEAFDEILAEGLDLTATVRNLLEAKLRVDALPARQADLLVVAARRSSLAGCTRKLKRRFGRVRRVGSTEGALEALDLRHPRIILIQSNLPDMAAYRLLRDLKGDGVTRRIPVILVDDSREHGEEPPQRGWDLGQGKSGGYYDLANGIAGLLDLIVRLTATTDDGGPPPGRDVSFGDARAAA